MIRLSAVLGVLVLCPIVASAEEIKPKVHVDRNVGQICPIDDCYLTLVDETLCVIIDQVFDPQVVSFSNILNCFDGNDNSYVCLNVLAQKRHSEERQADYSDPYIVELMTNFQVGLDRCLGEWEKGFTLQQNRQAVTYEMGNAKVILALSEYQRGPTKYDRLTLELSQTP
ncbi:hypothetical protein [Sinorhizobium saheli]|uniref:hypothetical protein n=1 Tax=Sinorhizobium saheli TaxID=36856 RepID=UPI001297CBB8|nr:hypothetical protein [Sinorhizobium saheli]MQW85986.1 hypothetical protein [Sinorhizobium saheli]